MAITIFGQPDDFQSTGRPDYWILTSDRVGGNIPSEYTTFLTISPASPTQITTYGLGTNDAVLELSAAFTSAPGPGDKLYIDDGIYDGPLTVLQELTSTLYVVDTDATVTPSFGGNCWKYYDNFQIRATFYFGNAAGAFGIEYLTGRPDENEQIRISPHELAKRFFTRPPIEGTTPTIIGTEPSQSGLTEMAMDYWVEFDEYATDGYEGLALYDQTGQQGPKRLLNSKHPRLKMDIDGNKVLDWDDDYTGFQLDALTPSGANLSWLTYAPTTTVMSDVGYLSFITDGSVNTQFQIVAFDENDAVLWTHTPTIATIDGAAYLGCGPTQLEAEGESMAGVKYYIIRSNNTLEDRTVYVGCQDSITFIWQNSLGGLDTFAFKGGRTANTNTERFTSKPEYNNEKVFRTEAQNEYTLTTKPLDKETRYWLQELFNSDDTMIVVNGTVQNVILDNDTSFLDFEKPYEEIVIAYRLGYR